MGQAATMKEVAGRRANAPGRGTPTLEVGMRSDATTTRRDRRVSVKGHRGVYYREKAGGGRSYCIGYVDADGRWRWQTVPGKLRDADAAISEIRSKLHHGEH